MELDHVVHYVPDLGEAQRQYEALGFVMKDGGKHSYGTQNIVTRLRRSYIEPITIENWDLLRQKRPAWVYELLHEVINEGGGAISFGVSVDNIERIAEYLRVANIKFTLRSGSIRRFNGTMKTWKYILLDEGPSKWNPFIIDYGVSWEERAERYGERDQWTMSRIVIETLKPFEYGHWVARVFGKAAITIDRGVRVTIGSGSVDIVEGDAERITQVLFEESDAPTGDIYRLHYGVNPC